jgi:signal transduction histidine kinase
MLEAIPSFLINGVALIAAVSLPLILAVSTGSSHLLSTNSFIPHGHCYLWKPGLVMLHVTSDLLIALAYIAISATLAYLVYRTRQKIPFHWMFLAFGSFIVACGSTHLMEVWTLWHPNYWFSGVLKLITAIASVTTAIVLPPLVPQALGLVETAQLSEERRSHLETANQTLATLNEQLQELDRLKTQFFANVSHELRTPLALILGPTEKLLKSATLDPTEKQDLEIISRNAHLLLKQVNDLLDVAKLEAGKITPNYAQVDLTPLVRLTAANFDALAQEKQITFTVDTPETVKAEVDDAKVQRILLNLLSNAFKFTPSEGSIHCSLTMHDHNRVRIAVQDSGPGVPVELRETIFERFSQGEGSNTRRFGGTGLGLAIVKEFVELQHGSVWVSEAPTGGALFTVELPLVAPDVVIVSSSKTNKFQFSDETAKLVVQELQPVVKASANDREQEAGRATVLVVEDNPEMNQFITNTLSREYCTATAATGQEGVEKALQLHPDLILSDVMMPGLSGEQLVQQLRQHPEFDTTPIIMLTAKADDELRVHLLRQGVQDYLMKPFSVEELQARVGNLIAIKRVRDRLQQELASQSSDLEALVEEVTLRRRELQVALNALQHQADELERANRLKDEFLAIVSHELRTPLNVILGWAQTLRARTLDAATTARALENIERNARLQTQLIENLLDISRLLRGKLLLDKRLLDLKPILRSAIQRMQAEAEDKGIELLTDFDRPVGLVTGDAVRLQQIAENLLSNAIKFTPNGGKVEVRLEQELSEVKVSISDTGQGISAEFLPHVFDYFRQADSSITRSYGGLGLGLAIVRQLVELHQGTIEVESLGEGKGSTFTVTFPLQTAPVPPPYTF